MMRMFGFSVPAKLTSVKCNQPTQVLVLNKAELLFLGRDKIGTQKQHHVFLTGAT